MKAITATGRRLAAAGVLTLLSAMAPSIGAQAGRAQQYMQTRQQQAQMQQMAQRMDRIQERAQELQRHQDFQNDRDMQRDMDRLRQHMDTMAGEMENTIQTMERMQKRLGPSTPR